MLKGVFAITFFPTTDSQFIVGTCDLVADSRRSVIISLSRDWPQLGGQSESSLSMISSSSELSSKSDQFLPLSQRLLLHPIAFLPSLFRFFCDLVLICNELFDAVFFLLKLLIFYHKRFYLCFTQYKKCSN